MEDAVRKIIEAGCQAPSGSNSQPWRFEVNGNTITVIAEPEKDHPILNVRNRGTWIAHGALLENMEIASRHFGLSMQTQIFPDLSNPNTTARCTLTKTAPHSEPLFDAIGKRATNRKPYATHPLMSDERTALLSTVKPHEATLLLIEDKERIKTLAHASSVNEIIMFENQKLHKLFFEEIVWDEKTEHRKQSGLYVKTMELAPPQRMIVKLLRNWSTMRVFNRVQFARKAIAGTNAKTYARAAAMGAIVIPDTDEAFLFAGQLMERAWLTATHLGLSLQLLTGVLFLQQGVELASQGTIYSNEHRNLIERAYQDTLTALGNPTGRVALLFRIGKDGEPSARSSKKTPTITTR